MAVAGAGGPTVGLQATVRDIHASPLTSFGRIQLKNDGTNDLTGNGSSANAWYSAAPMAGIGTDFWAKFHLSSGDAWSGVTPDTIVALSTEPSLSWSAGAGQSKNAIVAVTFYVDAAGANVVATGSITADVESTP